jgi:asparagine synthase (glutamine-hydrolysing)
VCGIAGIVGGSTPPTDVLERMASAMVHRGPDADGRWHDDIAGFAFRRLAVIDLDDRSNQPLHFGALHLVFNGEIYNYLELRADLRSRGHRFSTNGDGEVLLHAWAEWGERTLDRVNGMFAFAIWDTNVRRLTLATDPFGEKPLYWRREGERIVFGSTIGAILRASPAANVADSVLAAYVALARLPNPGGSFVRDIQRLPGAHLLRWERGLVLTRRYWRPTPASTPDSFDAAAARLRELLTSSIQLRLRSDVPVGTSLSGGVDSSSIVALCASLAGTHLRHAFTARFPGFEKDEWSRAALTAAAADVTEHHPVEPTADGLLDDLERLVVDHEEPVLGSSVYAQWCVMRAAAHAGVVVILDGQGADEALAGYDGTVGYALLGNRPLRGLIDPRRAQLVRCAAALWAPRPLVRRYRLTLCSPYAPRDIRRTAAALEPPYEPWFAREAPLRRELLLQMTASSLPELLRYADRNSMAHGREVRLPFLDRNVVEFSLGLPAHFLYHANETKRVLRAGVRHSVPSEALEPREKIGYATPEARWLSHPAVRARIAEVLIDRETAQRGWLDVRSVEADVRANRWRDPAGIWRAVNAELWTRALKTGLSRPSLSLA